VLRKRDGSRHLVAFDETVARPDGCSVYGQLSRAQARLHASARHTGPGGHHGVGAFPRVLGPGAKRDHGAAAASSLRLDGRLVTISMRTTPATIAMSATLNTGQT
jgi:hypothetical protein